MNKFNEIWKNKANNKNLSREDMLAYCLIKAVKAKEPNKEMLARIFVLKAFTAGAICQHRYHPYQSVREAASRVRYYFKFQSLVLGTKVTEIMSDEELDVFASIIEKFREFNQ